MGRIVWIASYPKSGNTWVRVFLENLLRNAAKPVDINALGMTSHGASRATLDETLGVDTSDLTAEEIDNLYPDICLYWSNKANRQMYIKTHVAWRYLSNGGAPSTIEATRCVLYLVRHPFDVAVSYANHNGVDVEQAICHMENEEHTLCRKTSRVYPQIRQRLGSWSSHVHSWLNSAVTPLLPVRYEDMRSQPFEIFRAIVRFFGLPHEDEAIQRALDHSDFAEMQRQESVNGFSEKAWKCGRFFHRGKVGSWRDLLNTEQVQRIVDRHGAVMQSLGYGFDGSCSPIPESIVRREVSYCGQKQ